MKFDTKLLHAGHNPKEHQMCINVPIYPTTAFDFDDVQRGADLFDLKVEGDIYTRLSNPTNNILEKRLAELEEEEEQKRNRREVYYGKDANIKYQRSRRRHIYIFNPEDLDNADIISMVENTPTYSRDKGTLNTIKNKAEQEGILATEEAQGDGTGEGGIITF